jgi:pyruvate dehydrogenase E1 component alpha subunit
MISSVLRTGSARMLRASAASASTLVGSNNLVANSLSSTQFRSFSSGETATFNLESSFEVHNLDSAPSQTVECSKDELLNMFKLMYTMRRMEITCDNEYKARNIRGFCHLYDGQEAVATGIQNAFEEADSWITSYRCHCVALARGAAVSTIVGELFGNSIGSSKGKGGSMHFYNKKKNFYGGQGIVGAQVPVGAGLAFANKYKAPPGEKMQVAIACYGDGAANQGQIWEAANMSALWKLVRSFSFFLSFSRISLSLSCLGCSQHYITLTSHITHLTPLHSP